MAKDIKQIPEQEQDPQAGGSYIRNEDGSLVKNEADPQKNNAGRRSCSANIKGLDHG